MHTSEVPRMYHKEVQPSTAELRRTIIIHGSNFEQSKKVQWPSRCRFKISTYGFPTQRNRTPNFDSKNIEDIIVGGVVWMSNFWWLQPHLQFYKRSILNQPSGNFYMTMENHPLCRSCSNCMFLLLGNLMGFPIAMFHYLAGDQRRIRTVLVHAKGFHVSKLLAKEPGCNSCCDIDGTHIPLDPLDSMW